MIIQKGGLLFLQAENSALVFVTHSPKINHVFCLRDLAMTH